MVLLISVALSELLNTTAVVAESAMPQQALAPLQVPFIQTRLPANRGPELPSMRTAWHRLTVLLPRTSIQLRSTRVSLTPPENTIAALAVTSVGRVSPVAVVNSESSM